PPGGPGAGLLGQGLPDLGGDGPGRGGAGGRGGRGQRDRRRRARRGQTPAGGRTRGARGRRAAGQTPGGGAGLLRGSPGDRAVRGGGDRRRGAGRRPGGRRPPRRRDRCARRHRPRGAGRDRGRGRGAHRAGRPAAEALTRAPPVLRASGGWKEAPGRPDGERRRACTRSGRPETGKIDYSVSGPSALATGSSTAGSNGARKYTIPRSRPASAHAAASAATALGSTGPSGSTRMWVDVTISAGARPRRAPRSART